MEDIYKSISERLDYKRKELTEKQEHFIVMCQNEMQSSCFERNAISDLIVMQQLKSEIQELEHWELLIRSQINKGGE